MIKHVGFPKCVCAKPFILVHSPAEERAYKRKKESKKTENK